MNKVFDVIVIGGGVIGTTSAWKLAKTGRRVLLLERQRCGAEASSAAAGMLGAQLEVSEPGSFYHLCLESRSLYQAFVDELYETTGIDAQLTHNGILQLAYSEKEVDALQTRMQWQRENGSRAEWLSHTDVAAQESTLSTSHGALLLPDDGNVNAPLLVSALEAAVKRHCRVVEGVEVTDIQRDVHGHYTVVTPTVNYASESIVIATGAWASRLLRPFAPQCVTQPVKGQLLSIRPRNGQQLHRTVFNNHSYMVPKRDGTIIVGATEDRVAGFNRDVVIDAIAYLLATAGRIAPGLCDAVFERSWTGIRPGTSDDRPWIGELPEFPGLHVAVGHFRNGILLAPVSGDMIVQAMDGQSWPHHWQAFHAGRTPVLKSEAR